MTDPEEEGQPRKLTATEPISRETAWNRLRYIAQEVKGATRNLDPADALAYALNAFFEFTDSPNDPRSEIAKTVRQFRAEVLGTLASEICHDRIVLTSIPGRPKKGVIHIPEHAASVGMRNSLTDIEPALQLPLESVNGKYYPDVTEEHVHNSLFWVLIASLGVDPGDLENVRRNIGTLGNLSGGIMSGARVSPPFNKSETYPATIEAPTAIPGVSVTIDQNCRSNLCLFPSVLESIIGKCNQSLPQEEIPDDRLKRGAWYKQREANLQNVLLTTPDTVIIS